MFAAFADAYGNYGKLNATEARRRAVAYLRETERMENFYAPAPAEGHSTWAEYLRIMAQDGVWGDHLVLSALAEVFKVTIVVLKYERGVYTMPKIGRHTRRVKLYLTDNHYEVLYNSQFMV
jgi:hypothetical protein